MLSPPTPISYSAPPETPGYRFAPQVSGAADLLTHKTARALISSK